MAINDKMTATLQKMIERMNRLVAATETVNDVTSKPVDAKMLDGFISDVNEAIRHTQELQNEIRQLQDGAARASPGVEKLFKAFGAAAALKIGQKAGQFFSDSIDLTQVKQSAEAQLGTVLKNMEAEKGSFSAITGTAGDLQGKTMYGKTALIGGAAELSTYLSDAKAIQSVMGTLTNYAAGMSGGTEVTQQQMVDYATQLGKVFSGAYDGISKKGFTVTDAQKKIIEYGTDMEKAAVIADIIDESWAGLAETMANLPMGKLATLKNEFLGIREELGAMLLPELGNFFGIILTNMPKIKGLMMGFGEGVARLISIIGSVAGFMLDHWNGISIALKIAGVFLGIYTGMLIANKIATLAAAAAEGIKAIAHASGTAATLTATGAQLGLNAAMWACPITWIIAAIIALIAIIYVVISAINKASDTTDSALGWIVGAVYVAGAAIANFIIGLLNGIIQALWNTFVTPIADAVNWIYNVFNGGFDSIGDAFINLLGNMLAWFVGFAKPFTAIWDKITGSNITADVEALQGSLRGWGKGENYQEIMPSNAPFQIQKQYDYDHAWQAGKNRGNSWSSSMKAVGEGQDWDALLNGVGGIEENTGDTANNTSKTSEDLVWLRDIAERDALNRVSVSNITLNMNNQNSFSSDMDVDGFTDSIVTGLQEVRASSAEGVYA